MRAQDDEIDGVHLGGPDNPVEGVAFLDQDTRRHGAQLRQPAAACRRRESPLAARPRSG